MDVFWDLVRQGILILGYNRNNMGFPFCRVSHSGKRMLEDQNTYFFHDAATYETLIRTEVPDIDPVTLVYLREAMQAFRVDCILSASVMLGVATEHTFMLLLETIAENPAHASTYTSVKKERAVLGRMNKFRTILDRQMATLPCEIKEDLDTHFAGILSIIRTFRNQSGHPTGKIIDREQAYVLLNLFVPYCRKMYQLMAFFA